MTIYNTRIAPSPTGDMHIGTARTAYFNWLAARATNGKFYLRIDDTDTARNDASKIDDIYDIMDWLGLDYDDCVKQSDRCAIYNYYAHKLVDDGKARFDDGCIRLNDGFDMNWVDSLSGPQSPSDIDVRNASNTVLLKSDGGVTYHFATVLDDISMDINHVIRGKDHINNTYRHAAIYNALGHDVPLYTHVGLLMNGKGKGKVSKRDGAASMLGWRDKGYDPDAMLNFMLRLGWGPNVDDKTSNIIDRDRALTMFFDAGHMRNVNSNIDLVKLDWYNKKYKGRKRV